MKPIGRRVRSVVMIVAVAAGMVVASTGIAHAGTSTFNSSLQGDSAAAGLSAQQLAKRDAFAKRTGRSATALDGPWHFVNLHSDKCLTISGASTANNAGAVQYTCDFLAPHNEDWYLEDPYGTGVFLHIINAHSGKCLTISGASTANNAGAVQYTCDTSYPHNEDWYLENVSGPRASWHVNNDHSGKCLTVSGASIANNAGAVQYTCDYSLPFNEEWAIRY